jgi:prepilin-type N-terminal cleavage/methylation domain-containing protein
MAGQAGPHAHGLYGDLPDEVTPMTTRTSTRNGFTLVEIMVAVAITTLMVGMIYTMLAAGQEAWDIKSTQTDMQARGRLAMSQMVKELRQTTRTSTQNPSPNIAIPSTPNNRQIDFYLPLDLDGDGTIADTNGAVEWDTSNKIQYQYVPGQTMLRRLEKGEKQTIALNVSDVRFIDQGIDPALYPNELKITLTLQAKTKRQRTLSRDFTAMVKMRN